jgi:Transposase DDE domain
VGQPGKQGYNAQAAVNESRIIVAAEVMCRSGDFGNLEPMVEATERELEAAGVTEKPETVVADPGYFHNQQIKAVEQRGTRVLIPPQARLTTKPRAGSNKGLQAEMRERLAGEDGQAL